MEVDKNGENYENKLWIWLVAIIIVISSVAVMSQILIKTPWQYL
jgi:hypothetical protein